MRFFLGFGQVPYIGAPSSQAFKLAGISGGVIPLFFPWLAYGAGTAKPNINALVNIDTMVCKQVDQIRSVYIDNLGCNVPVYVYFPDTQYTVVAQPNSEGWYPAYTNAKNFWVIAEGFLDGSVTQTLINVSNVPLPANVNLEFPQVAPLYRASPIITRGNSIYNTSYGVPALGDQLANPGALTWGSGVQQSGIWATPQPSGFIIVTSILINLMGVKNSVATFGLLNVESSGIAGTLLSAVPFMTPNTFADAPSGVQTIVNMSGLQLKLDATQTWRLRVLIGSDQGGQFQFLSSFTYIPN